MEFTHFLRGTKQEALAQVSARASCLTGHFCLTCGKNLIIEW